MSQAITVSAIHFNSCQQRLALLIAYFQANLQGHKVTKYYKVKGPCICMWYIIKGSGIISGHIFRTYILDMFSALVTLQHLHIDVPECAQINS